MRVLALALLVACSGPEISGTTCNDDSACNLFNVQGRCEPTGFCSYPDETCESGQRYSPGADDLANNCVPGAPVCGLRDQACCGTGVCAANLTCAGEAGTCQCGEAGQPCCDGTTCGADLRCATGATCTSNQVKQVAAGAGHACALFSDNAVACWGHDFKPQSGTAGCGEAVLSAARPLTITGLGDVADLRAGEFHTCARRSDGTLWCWGHNENGQLGDGTTMHSKTPVQVAGLSGVTMYDGGRRHACGVALYNGMPGLWCWGRGGENMHNGMSAAGKLGNNSATDSKVPVKVDLSAAAGSGQTVRSLSAGSYHTCIVMSDDKTWCWGRNSHGELGDGTTTSSRVPVQVNYAGITIPQGVTVGEVVTTDGRRKQGSTCIRLTDGTVYCWGSGNLGELGDGTTADRSAPSTPVDTSMLGAAKIVQLAAAQQAKCARTDTGDVWCWGDNRNGLLGNNDEMTMPQPRPVKTSAVGATQLVMSHRLACAIDGAKQLYCWGTNKRGQSKARPPADEMDTRTLEPTRVAF